MGACDQGTQQNKNTTGPLISITGANIAEGKLPANGTIQIGFDRLLNPLTVTRQTVQLRDASDQPVTPPPVVQYDPVARVVTLSDPSTTPGSPPWLVPQQSYKVRVGIPANGADDLGGIRAIDRATLNAADPLRVMDFIATAAGTAPTEPKARFCSDVLPIFQKSCLTSTCHSTPRAPTDRGPAAGLILEFWSGVQNTAISRVANGANTGPLAGTGAPPQRLFGVDMPIIDPGNPGNSWLLYKVLLATPIDPKDFSEAVRTKCDGTPGTKPVAAAVPDFVSLESRQQVMDDVERSILSDYVLGREMPYPYLNATGTVPSQGLTFDELERIRSWIAQGAEMNTDCGACE